MGNSMRHGTARKVTIASATAGLLALVAGPGFADVGTNAALGGCPAHASVSITHTQSGGDSFYHVNGSVTTLSNCRAEAEVLVTPERSGDTDSFLVLDSRSAEQGAEGGLALLGDGVGVTFYIQSYDLGGDVSNRTAACTTYVGGSCGV
jgi:hypothetical protein